MRLQSSATGWSLGASSCTNHELFAESLRLQVQILLCLIPVSPLDVQPLVKRQPLSLERQRQRAELALSDREKVGGRSDMVEVSRGQIGDLEGLWEHVGSWEVGWDVKLGHTMSL